jgi:putative phage-type endonuclease
MITDEQRKQRKNFLGSSDAAAIVGVDPYRNAADVYWSKINDIDELKETPAIKAGKFLERAVLDWFEDETGKTICRDQLRVHENGIMSANFDALVVDNQEEAVEAKTSGIIGYLDREQWGEVGTDQVPEHIIVQCQHQMAIIPSIKIVWIPTILGGVGFCMYKVERDDSLIRNLEIAEVKFWNEFVENKIAPPEELASLETIKRIKRVPNKSVQLNDDLVTLWLEAKKLASEAEKEKIEIQKKLFAELGDAEAGECSFGRLTYYEQSVKEKIIPASSYRVARFKERKAVAA